jgi:hypothetical protein
VTWQTIVVFAVPSLAGLYLIGDGTRALIRRAQWKRLGRELADAKWRTQ